MKLDQRTFYVLRHVPTGKLMPSFKGRAGGTYVDPFNSKDAPRLFTTPLAAKNALAWWSEGRVRVQRDADFGNEIVGVTPVEGREASDWEVIAAYVSTENIE